MKRRLCLVAICGLVALSYVAAVQSQEPPKPGPEHDLLKAMVGTWESSLKAEGAPESKGTMTYKIECNGLWLTSNFEGEFAGQPFQGKGFDTYDATKKKFVSVWVDSMSTTPLQLEGDYDKEKKTRTMVGNFTGPDGNPAKFKSVTELKEKDKMTFKMFLIPEGGDELPMMTIEYKRKK